tara:strand:+ start:369 stop:920 length:552 start_codon:yes stop_codon:yes gene_type:complete
MEDLEKLLDQRMMESGQRKINPVKKLENSFPFYSDEQRTKLFKGIMEGIKDWKDPEYDANPQKGQRTKEAQKAVDVYTKYKAAGKSYLDKGLINEEEFNYLKGKAGAKSWVDYYISNKEFPEENKLASHGVNLFYQVKQTLDGGQSWGEGLEDLIEQGKGIEDNTPLETPYKELQNLMMKRTK